MRAVEHHGRVMRLLIRRYVTAEQRTRDEYGITEDDVMEIRQDISTLRYELIDILHQNGMKTPALSKDVQRKNLIDRMYRIFYCKLVTASGKKEKVMERRILKDFHIGSIENTLEHFCMPKQPQDVFTQLAKAIKMKTSQKSKRKDWNVLVKQNSLDRDRDPIGSTKELEKTVQNRKSLRKSIKEPKSQSSEDLLGRMLFARQVCLFCIIYDSFYLLTYI